MGYRAERIEPRNGGEDLWAQGVKSAEGFAEVSGRRFANDVDGHPECGEAVGNPDRLV
jgi:hypothetical protein